MLKISNLTKSYDGVVALDDISLKIEKGDIYGFLGPNGAGKTTAIRIIMGIIKQDSGKIELNGYDTNNLNNISLGYLPEDRGLYQKQNLEEVITYFARLRGLDIKVAKKRTKMWLDRFSLSTRKRRKIEELSKGNQQKVQFVLSLIHEPMILILDEPFTGLDPINQLLIKNIIKEIQSDGKTILFSTHQMGQVERMCNRICLMNKGSVVLEGNLSEIKSSYRSNSIEMIYEGKLEKNEIKAFLSEFSINQNTLKGILRTDSDSFLKWAISKVLISSFKIKVPDLEQIFIEKIKSN
tara:strand:- start:680 stop:1564 length:885 start_codon:yes stop_codon:yes gene_type:complete